MSRRESRCLGANDLLRSLYVPEIDEGERVNITRSSIYSIAVCFMVSLSFHEI